MTLHWIQWDLVEACALQSHLVMKANHHNRFTALFLGPPGWASARKEHLDFMVQREINRGRHSDHPAGRHSTQTNQCPPPPTPLWKQTFGTTGTGVFVIPVTKSTAKQPWRELKAVIATRKSHTLASSFLNWHTREGMSNSLHASTLMPVYKTSPTLSDC